MMASDLSSGCTETIDILDDEKEEGEISLEDVSSSEEGGMGHLTSSYVVGRMRACPDCKSWGDCATWCNATYHPKNQSRRGKVILDLVSVVDVSFFFVHILYLCLKLRPDSIHVKLTLILVFNVYFFLNLKIQFSLYLFNGEF